MAFSDLTSSRSPVLARPLELVCIALVFANATYLLASYLQGIWLVGAEGGVASDFVNVWAAGKLTLGHEAALAYDWPTHKSIEELAVGHAFDGYFGWHYPPTFLFIAATLAFVPYAPAYVLWLLATFPAYIGAVRAIIGDRSGYLLGAAFPALLSNFVVGQNGFLTAGLIGGALVMLVERPILAGVLVGCVTYKPHLGLLFPIVLAASGHWRVFASAAVTAALMAAASWLAFGSETWIAFAQSIPHTSQAFLSDGWANFGKLQTLFGLSRALGVPEVGAWTLQAALALDAAVVVAMIWRSNAAFEIKAAALATGALLATPYLYTYDLVVLAVPLAYLFRLGRRQSFLPYEAGGMALACVLIGSFPFVAAPVGFAAVVIVAALVLRRAWLWTPQR
jgi:arabinofuranan 3-O-arabinosyltransferase